MLDITVARKIFDKVSGSSFVGIDTLTEVSLLGGKGNPQKGRVTKRTIGSNVMVFQNKTINGYKAMVERRLEKEGKKASDFKIQPRSWGTRIEDTPFVEHTKDGVTTYYLEVIFLKGGDSVYMLDGKVVSKSVIIGLKPRKEGVQGGLDNNVVIRSYKLDSITNVRIDGVDYKVN